MSDTKLDQAEEILSYKEEISDEALESAAGDQTGGQLHSLLLHRF